MADKYCFPQLLFNAGYVCRMQFALLANFLACLQYNADGDYWPCAFNKVVGQLEVGALGEGVPFLFPACMLLIVAALWLRFPQGIGLRTRRDAARGLALVFVQLLLEHRRHEGVGSSVVARTAFKVASLVRVRWLRHRGRHGNGHRKWW